MAENVSKGAIQFVEKHWVWVVGGVAGLLLLYLIMSGSSGGSSSSGTVATALPSSTDNTADQVALMNAQTAAAAEASQAALQTAQLNASIKSTEQQNHIAALTAEAGGASAYLQSEGNAAQSVANAYANTVQANDILPATAIAAGTALDTAALNNAAQVTEVTQASESNSINAFGSAIGQASNAASQLVSNVAKANQPSGSLLNPLSLLGGANSLFSEGGGTALGGLGSSGLLSSGIGALSFL
jgi:hypothetical protein